MVSQDMNEPHERNVAMIASDATARALYNAFDKRTVEARVLRERHFLRFAWAIVNALTMAVMPRKLGQRSH
jgi:hypothetical protein